MEKLLENPTKEFAKLDRDADKIRYCYQRLKANNLINDKGIGCGKNGRLALEARSQGNFSYIKDKDFVRALEHYNKSICLSPAESENIGICYANRSAIYFESHLYALSLENIELALSHHYPEKLTQKLKDRQSKCLEKLGSDKIKVYNKEIPVVKLSYPANKRIPNIIDGIECRKSNEFGRYVRAKHALYPGDIIMIDKQYINCLNEGSEYVKCNNCVQSKFLNLFPCPHCSKAMYCGKACEQVAWKRFHQYECQVIETDLAVRATLFSFTLFDECAKLKDLIDSTKKKAVTGFNLNYNNLTEEVTFKAIYSLATNSSQRSTKDFFKKSNVLAQSWHSLITITKLRDLLKTTDEEDFFLDTLLHFSQLVSTNCHELHHMTRTPAVEMDKIGIYSPQKFGSALFPIISLLNHSCAPNVQRVNNNGTMIMLVVRSIKSGEQLFDSYECDHVRCTREVRHAKLSTYLFECKCEACLFDWPMTNGLKIKGLTGLLKFYQMSGDLEKIWKYDPAWAAEYLKKCKKFLKEFGHHYPSFEVCTATGLVAVCGDILYMNKPLELQLTPRT